MRTRRGPTSRTCWGLPARRSSPFSTDTHRGDLSEKGLLIKIDERSPTDRCAEKRHCSGSDNPRTEKAPSKVKAGKLPPPRAAAGSGSGCVVLRHAALDVQIQRFTSRRREQPGERGVVRRPL